MSFSGLISELGLFGIGLLLLHGLALLHLIFSPGSLSKKFLWGSVLLLPIVGAAVYFVFALYDPPPPKDEHLVNMVRPPHFDPWDNRGQANFPELFGKFIKRISKK